MSFRVANIGIPQCIQAPYMRSPIHCPFCRYSPLVASVSLHISWVWRGIAAGLDASLIATCLAWLLTTRIRQKHAALQKLNHELRNGLQILSYVCSQCEPEVAEQARAADAYHLRYCKRMQAIGSLISFNRLAVGKQ